MERTKSKGKKSYEKIRKKIINVDLDKYKIRKILIFLLIIFLILIIIETYKSILNYLLIPTLIILNFIFALIKRFFSKLRLSKYLYGFEIVTFSTILISFNFGSFIGSISGVLLMSLNYIAEKRFSKYFIITLPLYFFIGYTAYFFRRYNFSLTGIAYTIIYNLISFLISLKLGANKTSLIIFNTINILFNILLFLFFTSIRI